MAKELPFFQFEPAMWMMGRIQRCSCNARASFVDLMCRYWNAKCDYSIEDAELDCGEDEISELLKRKIIKEVEGKVVISFLKDQYDNCLETTKKRKKAADARWSKSNASAMHVHKSAMQNDADKIRRDKIIEDNIDYKSFVEFFNKTTGKNIRVTDTLKKDLRARIKDGYTKEDIIRVVRVKSAQWKDDKEMNKYLRPQTLFSKSKFEAYVDEQPAPNKPNRLRLR